MLIDNRWWDQQLSLRGIIKGREIGQPTAEGKHFVIPKLIISVTNVLI